MKILVTQKHIDEGDTATCASCPIALALRDAGSYDPHVRQHRCRHKGIRYALPPEATKFIEHFDNSLDVYPFEFELEDTI